jgi:hypothetical protein
VCQYLPADPIDAHVVQAFLAVLSPVELDLYAKAMAAIHQEEGHVEQARRQQVERLRYQAHLAERQFNQADPDNRLVTAELERRWETALHELQEAEEVSHREQHPCAAEDQLTPEMRKAFAEAGKSIPVLWQQDLLAQEQKKALLRSLIDKVVVHRSAPDIIQTRIIWKGGETTTTAIPVTVGSLARLSSGREMEKAILKQAKKGQTDVAIAARLTQEGYRSPKHATVLPSTVRIIRLRHRVFRQRSQSHPRRIAGSLTVTQVARQLDLTTHWIYDRIHNGTIQIARDAKTKLYLFPDKPKTITLFQQLRADKLQKLRF